MDEKQLTAVITLLPDNDKYTVSITNETSLTQYFRSLFGDRPCDHNMVPVSIDAAGWCLHADVGDKYVDSEFTIELIN